MKTFSFYDTACFDPLTLLTAATTAMGVGGRANSLFNKPSAPKMPAPAAPIQSPMGGPENNTQNTQGQSGPSFLSAAAAPSSTQLGAKSLLGQ